MVTTFGADGPIAWDGQRLWHEPALPVEILDRLGAGDALAAGVVHGWLNGSLAEGLRYGVVLAALILTQYGDMVLTTPDEVEMLLTRTGGGMLR